MVLGKGVNSVINCGKTDTKCGGYRKENYLNDLDKKNQKDQIKSQNDKNYGAWGPVFKNRQNFNSMHIC